MGGVAAGRGEPHAGLGRATVLRNYACSNNGSRLVPARRRTRHPVEEVLTVREGEAEMWIEDNI